MLRSAETLDVSEHARTIELIVMPYGTPTRVPHKGRMVTEIIAPGAFDGIEQQTNRIRVNRDHTLDRTVGVATRLDPHDRRGLNAEIKIARTELGDETLDARRRRLPRRVRRVRLPRRSAGRDAAPTPSRRRGSGTSH